MEEHGFGARLLAVRQLHQGLGHPLAVVDVLLGVQVEVATFLERDTGARQVFSHTRRKNQTTASVIDGDWKFIRRVDKKGVTSRLYNWRADPEELTDRAAEHPVLAGLMAVAIQKRLADSTPPGVAEASPDEAVLDNLRALGYVD